MLRITRSLVALAFLVPAFLFQARPAAAAPLVPFQIEFPFTDPATSTVFTQFRLVFDYGGGSLSGVTILSADADLSAFTSNPLFISSAPIGVLPLVPPASPYVGAFKMGPIASSDFTVDPSTLDVYVNFGPGIFALVALGAPTCLVPSPDCWLAASFSSATLKLSNGIATDFFGDATYYGPIFDDTGLVMPATFAYALSNGALIGAGESTAAYDYQAIGQLQATSVPEPGTLALMSGALGIARMLRRRARRSAE